MPTSPNNNQKGSIRSEELINLHKCGFKLVPLSENHNPVVKRTPIYDDPDYWQEESFKNPTTCSKFKNVASTVGKTHLKDSDNNDLFIQALDIDSEYVFAIVTTPIALLKTSPNLKSSISGFLYELGLSENEFMNKTLLDVFKEHTYVSKTRKTYGFHMWWLSHKQNPSIRYQDCIKGYEFEIKADKMNPLCTLPPSTSKKDKTFRYAAIGKTTKLLISDSIYNILVGLLGDCLRKGDIKKNSWCNNDNKDNNNLGKIVGSQQSNNIVFRDLSTQTIQTSIDYLSPYYVEGDRNNFALPFSGTAFYSGVSEESAISIMKGICDKANDFDEKQSRLQTLRTTYKNGIEGRAITGGPTLADLISRIKNCDISFANNIVSNLKQLWRDDTKINKEGCDKAPTELSIAQAKREKSGLVKVKGTIIGLTPVYNMIKSVTLNCNACGYSTNISYPRPMYKTPLKEKNKCPSCPREEGFDNTVSVEPGYVSVVDIELQDLDANNEIERLTVKVFENDTYDIIAGEIVSVTGNLHVIRKNDNSHNKLETILFANSIDYVKRQEIVLTEEDIEKIQNWKQLQESQGQNSLDGLVSLFAPELIDLDHIKKGMLMVCANSGLRNIDTRLAKRLRINALIIGDPGLAKTKILEKTIRLIPNSQYAGGQSSTGLSLTSQISKEEGGMHTLRFGPIVLAKDSVCAINELGQLPLQEHKHLLDCMEENGFPLAKYGFSTFVEAHPSIIASANPLNNTWQNEGVVNYSEFPTLSQIIQRFDLIFVLRENTDEEYLKRYADKKKQIADNYNAGLYEGNEEFVKKYILLSRRFKPELTDAAYYLLRDFYINMGKAKVSGLPRKLDALIRITIAIAKLKLKNVADVEEAEEAMLYYNVGLNYFNQDAILAANPRDLSYEKIMEIIKENNGSPIPLTDAAIEACERNQDIKYYLLGKEGYENNNKERLKLNKNYHLREILDLLRNNDGIQIIQEKPITIRWKKDAKINNINIDTPNKEHKNEPSPEISYKNDEKQIQKAVKELSNTKRQQCDECDECEDNKATPKEILTISNDNTSPKHSVSGDETSENPNNNLSKLDVNSDDNIISKEIKTKTDAKNIGNENNNKSQILTEQPSSHTSHSSHGADENPTGHQYGENNQTNSDTIQDDQPQQIPRIQLNHSPNADIFTDFDDQIRSEDIEYSSSDNDLSSSRPTHR